MTARPRSPRPAPVPQARQGAFLGALVALFTAHPSLPEITMVHWTALDPPADPAVVAFVQVALMVTRHEDVVTWTGALPAEHVVATGRQSFADDDGHESIEQFAVLAGEALALPRGHLRFWAVEDMPDIAAAAVAASKASNGKAPAGSGPALAQIS